MLNAAYAMLARRAGEADRLAMFAGKESALREQLDAQLLPDSGDGPDAAVIPIRKVSLAELRQEWGV